MVPNVFFELERYIPLIGSLHEVERAGWRKRGVPSHLCESVLTHSVHAAQAAWYFTHDVRLTAMLVVHDLAESDPRVGDITPHDKVDKEEKCRLETRAMVEITSRHLYGGAVMNLWLEYEEGRSRRAKVAKQLDKLDAAVMAFTYEGMGFDVSEFFPYTRARLVDVRLIDIFDVLCTRKHDLRDSHELYFGLLNQARVRLQTKC